MGGGKKSKAPDPPNYAAAAQAQGVADKETAQYTTGLDRPDQENPYGLSQWSFTGSDINNPKPGDWKQTTYLTKAQQDIFEAQQRNDLAAQGVQGQGINMAKWLLANPHDYDVSAFKPAGNMQGSTTGLPQNTLDDMERLDESNLRFVNEGMAVRDAMYDQMTQFSDERFGKAEQAERTRLAQMGLQEGSKAYTNALSEFNRSKDESYQTAQLNAILAGGQEHSRLIGDQLAVRGSNINLGQSQFGQDLSRYGADQSERQAQATHALNLAQQAAAQRQQEFSEGAWKRNNLANEASMALGGNGNSQQMPQFNSFAPSTPFAAPDYLGAANAQYGAAMGGYNAGQSQKGGLLGAGAGLAGSFLGGK